MRTMIAAGACALAVPAAAQTAAPTIPDSATVMAPVLAFAATPAIEADFDKYF